VPIVNLPGCPTHPDTLSETIMYLLQQVNGAAPMIPLDEMLRPMWLFSTTVHEGCNRAGFYEEGEYATGYGAPRCLVKLGCWGPAVTCNVPKRGWINGIGGCPNVGGICIGCTMPGFPDSFMPFMDEPRGVTVPGPNVRYYSGFVRELRRITNKTLDREPPWRKPTERLLTGYEPPWKG
jgi:hydrogenase small subunit